MKFTVITEGYSSPQMRVEHDDQSLMFDLSSYNKNYLIGSYYDTCIHINKYWASLSNSKQLKIFNCYIAMQKVFDEVYITSQLCLALMPIVKALYEEHDLIEMERWLAFHGNIIVPNTFDEVYTHSIDKPFSREKTYTRTDYFKLVTLAFALRAMIPVWGQFILMTRNDVGTGFKEYYAYTLLAQTKINESPAVEKLHDYIENNIKNNKSIDTVITNGVGKEDYPNWILSGLLVKRISVIDIQGTDPHANLVVTVHNDLIAKNNGTSGNSFGEPIKEKRFEEDGENENGLSRLENYKIKAEQSLGDILDIECFSENYNHVAELLFPDVDYNLLNEFIISAKELINERIYPCQITLAQWILAPVIPPRGLVHLSKLHIINLLAVAQTYCWQKGHTRLAGLITATASVNSFSMQQSGIGSMARIPTDLLAEFNRLFPYSKVSGKRINTTITNDAVESVNLIASEFNSQDWVLTLPEDKLEMITGNKTMRRFSCPHDIKIVLSNLAIELAKRPIINRLN